MVVMALDHVRDFFHAGAMSQSPTDMATTTPAVFLTRWVTHFCAPVFLLVAGISAFLWMEWHGRTKTELSRFLLTRGIWLILVEVIVMRVAFDFSLDPKAPVLLITLWALGGSMVILAGLIHLPVRLLAALSVCTIVLHNLTDSVDAARIGAFAPLWNTLHQPGAFVVRGIVFVVGYPLLPLVATMAAGYCLGQVFTWDAGFRRRYLTRLGISLTVSFIVVRSVNIYGDPLRWSTQGSPVMTVLSFLNCTKYPASLDFLLMTLGPALLLLAALDDATFSGWKPILIFGRVPLFYFVVHFVWIHVIQVLITLIRYGPVPFLLLPPPSMGGPRELFPYGFGYPLWFVYAVWIFVVVTMYPACCWFAGFKRRRNDWWLGYL
jgi:uncharacterized membrane protein